MKDNFVIAIPSYKRADKIIKSENTTLTYMTSFLLNKTYLFIRDEEMEMEEYSEVYGKYSLGGISVLPNITKHIPETRDKIISKVLNCYSYEYLIMIDDDIQFAYRPNFDNHYMKQTPEIFEQMITKLLDNCNENCPLTGIVPRQFSNKFKEPIKENWRIIQVFCMHLPTIKKENIKFMDANIDYMTDYYFTLSLLQKGYKNKVLTQYTRDDIMQSPGGCSIYRTVENTNKSAVSLHKLFPNIVKPYIKSSGTWNEPRVNVRVSWKKAYREKEKINE